jgi:hypothetical protein
MGSHQIDSPDDWWAKVMGSGYRGTVEQLSPAERQRVRSENQDFIEREKIQSLEANVLYGLASV